jgi:HAD superfamily hydrolase (TIGR01509 family)
MAAADPLKPAAARPVTTVVFDFGGVLLEWNPRYLYRKIFADEAEMEWFLANVCTSDWNFAQDQGRPWPEAEAEAIARHPKYAGEIRAFRARWHEMVPHAIQGTVDVLEELAARGVPLYAITNFAADTCAECRNKFAFFRHFRGIIVSGEIGILKPDAAIYQRLASDYGLDLTTCLFIDDVPKNVDGAHATGMQAIRFESPAKLSADLIALSVL